MMNITLKSGKRIAISSIDALVGTVWLDQIAMPQPYLTESESRRLIERLKKGI